MPTSNLPTPIHANPSLLAYSEDPEVQAENELIAIKLILRIVGLLQRRMFRRAAIRTAQLANLGVRIPEVEDFILTCRFYAAYGNNPPIRAFHRLIGLADTAVTLALPGLRARLVEPNTPQAPTKTPQPSSPKLRRIGNDLRSLEQLIPGILAKARQVEENSGPRKGRKQADDLYVMDCLNAAVLNSLPADGVVFFTASIILSQFVMPEAVQRHWSIDLGLQPIWTHYLAMTEAKLVSVPRGDFVIVQGEVESALRARNAERLRAGLCEFVGIHLPRPVLRGSRAFVLLLPKDLATAPGVAVRRWDFAGRPDGLPTQFL